MPAYNFQQQFVPAVKAGLKRSTIRRSARGARPGAIAYLYTGQRTKACVKLGEAVIMSVCDIEIGLERSGQPYVTIGAGHYTGDDPGAMLYLDTLAICDGFRNINEMSAWIAKQYGLPFKGVVVCWGDLIIPKAEQ